MADTTQAQWWYAHQGQPRGPVSLEALQALASKGELQRGTLVWTGGMANWAPAETVGQLAWPAPPAAPPPLATPRVAPPSPVPSPVPAAPTPAAAEPSTGAGQPARAPHDTGRGPAHGSPTVFAPTWAAAPPSAAAPVGAASAVAEPGEVNVATTILLSIVTLGVYGIVKFFLTAKAYERLAAHETKFNLYFWLFVGLFLGSVLVNLGTGILGAPLALASLVFQFLTLGEALRARREALARWGFGVRVTSDDRHWLFFALGIFLTPLLIGVAFAIWQAVKWFEDWNAIRAAAMQRG